MKDYKLSLRAARINANMTQAEVASMAKIDTSTLKRWEANEDKVPIPAIYMLCAIYAVPIELLACGSRTL